MTGYQSGMRRHRITILNRNEATQSQFGRDAAGITWSEGATVWAAVDWTRGMSAMREGSLDAYGAIIVRIDYTTGITMRSRIPLERSGVPDTPRNIPSRLPGQHHTVPCTGNH